MYGHNLEKIFQDGLQVCFMWFLDYQDCQLW